MKKLVLMTLLALPVGMFAQTSAQETKAYATRAGNQRDRVAQGMKSGQITPAEKANLSARRTMINTEVAKEKAANGGQLTNAQERQVHRQVNSQSRHIYRYKHNGVN